MKNVSYHFRRNGLFIRSRGRPMRRVDFAWPIAEVIAFAEILVVRIQPKPGAKDNQNVFGVRSDGEIAWQVPHRQFIYDDSPFTGMMRTGTNVYLSNWDGTELIVDPSTGKVLHETYGK